ncbi:hypothetical protein FSP39_022332 [Pinctada imbricata]|uniref:Leucine-rich repeat and IQ domain-containing protein 3 n=1 Tax=Pinctada imbricata TaxID=66713 RepID=A0AA88XTZ6_PINIB|nr:hypothetical protein FSP39_022332 [Pinctada imbricata]
MVSIPDWTKFSRLHETLREPSQNVLMNKYYKQREEQAIKQAEERGYFKVPSQEYLLKESAYRNGRNVKEVGKLKLIKLCGVHLRKVGDIAFCYNLQICILNNNFLTKIDGLMTCHQLVRLDLHSNQLSDVPDMGFWSGMRRLEVLQLHDNPLGKYETLQSLATCPRLAALTLYDTPLSLKRNYRHHVANSIWSLKALDHHVISDEEIIEDATFGGSFGTLHPAFKIDLCPPTPEPRGLVDPDTDMYYKTPRPASSAPSDSLTITSTIKPPESIPEPFTTPVDEQIPTPYDESEAPRRRKNLLINLAKLQSGTFSSLYDEGIAIETILPEISLEKSGSAPPNTRRGRRKKKEREPQRRVIKSVKQFFGPVVETDKQVEEDKPENVEEDIPITEYRLRGIKPDIPYVDATTEMILTKQEAGRLIRDAEDEIHVKTREAPRPKLTPPKVTNSDQRMFARVHGTMGISSLLAVHQAYKDREKAERTAAKMEHILNLRDERDRAKERIRLFQDEKRKQALKRRDQERARMLEALEKREMKRIGYLDRRADIKVKSSDISRSFKADFTFITEFSNQHTSVSNALMRHDKQAKQEDTFSNKSEFVQSNKASKNEQQDVVKKYLEHRQLMRQTESAMAKNALDARMLQEANDRLMEAKQRVAQQKARREIVQAFYPLPQTITPGPGQEPRPVDREVSMTPGATHYEASALVAQGRVGKHPTLTT